MIHNRTSQHSDSQGALLPVEQMMARWAQRPLPCSLEQARGQFSDYQQLARTLNITLRAPPPEPTTCCGKGCNGCVWEGFYGATQFWLEDAQEALLRAATQNGSETP